MVEEEFYLLKKLVGSNIWKLLEYYFPKRFLQNMEGTAAYVLLIIFENPDTQEWCWHLTYSENL